MLDAARVRRIDRQRVCATARRPYVLRQLLAKIEAASADHDGRTLGGELQRGLAPHAARAADHGDDFSGKHAHGRRE